MGKVNREKWVRYTISIERALVADFKRVSLERGRKQNWVLAGFMRQYIGKPAREGGKKRVKKLSSEMDKKILGK